MGMNNNKLILFSPYLSLCSWSTDLLKVNKDMKIRIQFFSAKVKTEKEFNQKICTVA